MSENHPENKLQIRAKILSSIISMQNNSHDREFIKNTIAELNAIIADDQKLTEAFKQIAKEKRKFVYGVFRPYASRIAKALYYRGLLPSFLNSKRFKIITATLECESHNDILMTNLKLEK